MTERKILVVDDEQPIADILKFKLEKEGYSVAVANDGVEALEKVEEFNPDLILLDIMLPLDGRNGSLPGSPENFKSPDHHADSKGFRNRYGPRP